MYLTPADRSLAYARNTFEKLGIQHDGYITEIERAKTKIGGGHSPGVPSPEDQWALQPGFTYERGNRFVAPQIYTRTNPVTGEEEKAVDLRSSWHSGPFEGSRMSTAATNDSIQITTPEKKDIKTDFSLASRPHAPRFDNALETLQTTQSWLHNSPHDRDAQQAVKDADIDAVKQAKEAIAKTSLKARLSTIPAPRSKVRTAWTAAIESRRSQVERTS